VRSSTATAARQRHLAADARLLDEVTAAAWRAPIVEDLDGWQLRYGYGFTGRANSAWPRRDRGGLRLEEKLARLDAFYRERELLPAAQVSPASEPPDLDDELGRRGWSRSGEVLLETAPAPAVSRPGRGVVLSDRPDESWLDVWLAVRGFPREEVERTLPMLGGGAGTLFARVGDVAVGRATAHDGWVAITCMGTLPEARRRGAARTVLDALTAWAAEREACLCLNVEATNLPARALYESSGFAPVSAYWYRRAPA
jgi:ribosomal protein S18 acetylase RimI-like enzyme